MPEFFGQMQGLADELAAAGRPLDDEELISFTLAGLGNEYDAPVAAFGMLGTQLTVNELYSQLLAYDQRQ